MKLKLILLLCSAGIAAASPSFSQQKKISVSYDKQSLVSVLNDLRSKTGYEFFYYKDLIPASATVTLFRENATVEDIIGEIFPQNGLTYTLRENMIIVSRKENRPEQPPQQTITVRGVVTGPDGNPVTGVTVLLKGTEIGAMTDGQGRFSLAFNPERGNTLSFSMIGMEAVEAVVGARREFNIKLKESSTRVDEVVITGIFERAKASFTGSANTIKGEKLQGLASGNVLRALEMLDPGFRMNTSNISGSNPNAIPEFEMRGQSNMGDYSDDDFKIMRGDIDTRPNQPLFVLDGIIGVSVTTIIDLDPAQIESITLLKDAAAMVVYGSRASNGVVVVETRAPKPGQLRVSYNGNYKVQIPDLSVYDLLNAKDKLELERQAGFYDESYTAQQSANLNNYYLAKYMDVQRGVDTYWLAEPVQTGFSHRHGINLEGGDNILRYKLYFGANLQQGVMKGTGTDILTGAIDIRYRRNDLLISNQLTVDNTTGDRSSPYGAFSEYTYLNPYYRKRDDNGVIIRELENFIFQRSETGVGTYLGFENAIPTMNPMYNIHYNQKDRSTTLDLRNIFRIEYTPMDGLRLESSITLLRSNGEIDVFLPSNHTFFRGAGVEDRGIYNWTRTNRTDYNINFTASYNTVIKDKHLLSAFVRYDIDQRRVHTATVRMRGFPNDKMDEVFLGAKNTDVIGDEGLTRSVGFVGTASYSYDHRYAADFSVRIDASSEFGRNNRFAPFWSGGLRWNIHNEKFMDDTRMVDELVLRTTYGVTGSQGFSPYQSLQMYSYRGTMREYHSSPTVGAVLQSLGNPDLKWQKTTNFNVGVDFNILNRILSGRFEYYRKYTTNTLLAFSLPPSVGFETITDNMGNISNRGYEASLRIMPYNNVAKRLNFSIDLNGGHNVNRIEKISNALKVRNQEAAANVKSRPLPRYEEGFSQSKIWAVESLGIDPMSGREVFRTRTGEMTYEWSSLDQIAAGDTEPTMRGTVGLNLNWRGLSVNLAGGYRFGGQLYNRTLLDKVENANLRMNVDRRAYTKRWKQPGDVTLFKGVTQSVNGQATKASSRFVMDNNEFVLSSLTLAYRLEQREYKFLGNLGLTSAVVSLYFEDLLRKSTIRMERGIDYPFARQISMSLNLIF